MTEMEQWLVARIKLEREAKDPEGLVPGLEVALQALRAPWWAWSTPDGPLTSLGA